MSSHCRSTHAFDDRQGPTRTTLAARAATHHQALRPALQHRRQRSRRATIPAVVRPTARRTPARAQRHRGEAQPPPGGGAMTYLWIGVFIAICTAVMIAWVWVVER